jgi:hypothetical protein
MPCYWRIVLPIQIPARQDGGRGRGSAVLPLARRVLVDHCPAADPRKGAGRRAGKDAKDLDF